LIVTREFPDEWRNGALDAKTVLAMPARVLRNTFDERRTEEIGRELLSLAGIAVDGDAPHDIRVKDPRFYGRVLTDGKLGLGESYMEGWWDAPRLDETITRLLLSRLDRKIHDSWRMIANVLLAKLINLQSASRAFEVGERHYDIGNDLYRAMLDRRMVYTCGYWKDAGTLDEAQEAKLDLVCRKIGLRPGMRVLELGCGWGSFARFAAENYGAHVTGLTVSREQVALGTEVCRGLPVEIRLSDYRAATGVYDAVVSIGIMEHIGYKNYRTYMEVAERCLAPGGVAFIHTIAGNESRTAIDPWFHKYIFPNALLPSLAQLGSAMEGIFVLEDLHNIGPHYDATLMAWYDNFVAAWPELEARYGDPDGRFYRMWNYYLLSCAASFRARYTQLYQMVLTRVGTPQPACRAS
jgi:cyclopropane-fatty-acyl-phospholipid synthase